MVRLPLLRTGAYAIDCRDGRCPTVDPGRAPKDAARNRISGFADPSIRQGPDGVVWMAYSVPSSGDDPRGLLRVDTALARSDDDGATWTDAGTIWATEVGPDANIVREVPSLAVATLGSRPYWYGTRLDYGVRRDGTRDWSALRLVLVAAAVPPALATSTASVSLGAARTAAGRADVDLTAVGGRRDDLGRCDAWNEPALYVEGSTLYLAVRCLALGDGGAPIEEDSDLLVFSAAIADSPGDPHEWTWRYRGVLAGAAEAAELDGQATGLTEVDVASAPDGTLLAVVTTDSFNRAAQNFQHYGCFAVSARLDRPALQRIDGRLAVRASATASDNSPLGPGACAYAATTGLVLVRRDFSRGRGFVASLHVTGQLTR